MLFRRHERHLAKYILTRHVLPRNAKRRVAKESWEKVKAERGWVIIEALSRSCSSNNREILADAFRVMPPSSERRMITCIESYIYLIIQPLYYHAKERSILTAT